MKRVTLIIYSLSAGGAERVMSTLANDWAARGWPVTLLTLVDASEPPFYPLDARVTYRPLGIARASANPLRAVRNNLHRLWALRRAVQASTPDVVISFMDRTNVVTLLALRGLGLPVIVSEHNNPFRRKLGPVWDRLRGWTYPWAARFILLSEAYRAYFPPAIARLGLVIPNPILVDAAPEAPPHAPAATRMVIAMGRLTPQKGFDLLLRAFAQAAPDAPGWELTIWGEGPERAALEALRDELGLQGRAHLPGLTQQPFAAFRAAAIFALASRYEGFPMVLCEALACGLPAVCFDCAPGVRDIIREEVDSLLVPAEDVPAFAAALRRLMQQEPERHRLAARAPEVLERFGVAPVMRQWDQVIDEVCR